MKSRRPEQRAKRIVEVCFRNQETRVSRSECLIDRVDATERSEKIQIRSDSKPFNVSAIASPK